MTVLQQRAGWVQETYITDDTELLSASENERVERELAGESGGIVETVRDQYRVEVGGEE